MGRAAGVGHFDLRRFRGDRHRRGDSGAAHRADHGVIAGRPFRRRGTARVAVRRAALPAPRTHGRQRVDGPGGEDGRGGDCQRHHHRIVDSREGGRKRSELSGRLDDDDHDHSESLHRYFHRRLVVHPRPHLVLED